MAFSTQTGLRGVRFRLVSLLWGTLCIGSGAALWHNSDPWYFEREFRVGGGTRETERCELGGVSPDGKWVHAEIKGVKEKRSYYDTMVWNVASGQSFRIKLINGEYGASDCMSEFSKDSKLLIVRVMAQGGSRIEIWDVEKQKEIPVSRVKELNSGRAELSPDSRCLLVRLRDDSALLLDIQRDSAVLELRHVVWAEFSSSGDRVVVLGEDETIRIYDTVAGRELYRLHPPTDWKLGMYRYFSERCLIVHADLTEHEFGERESRGTVRFNLDEPEKPIVFAGALSKVSPDESLGVFTDVNEFRIVDLRTGIVNTRVQSAGERNNFEWMEGNSRIFDTYKGELFYTASGHRIYRIDGYGHKVFPDQSRFLSSKECIHLYDLTDGALLQKMPHEAVESFTSAVITSDSRHFVTQNDKTNAIHYWSQRRPEISWGLAWLPEFWLFLIFSAAFIHSVRSGIPAIVSAFCAFFMGR